MIKRFLLTLSVLIVGVSAVHAATQNDGVVIEEQWDGCYKGHRKPAAVIDYNQVPIVNNSHLGIDKVLNVIEQSVWNVQWRVVNRQITSEIGKLTAEVFVRDKHRVTVVITVQDNHLSIEYLSSEGMNAAFCGSKYYIHPNYNRWVGKLYREIMRNLSKEIR